MMNEKRSLKREMAKTAFRVFGNEMKEAVEKTVRTIREFAEETAEQVMNRTSSESAFVRFSFRTRAYYDRLVAEGVSHKEAYMRASEEIIEELCKETKENDGVGTLNEKKS